MLYFINSFSFIKFPFNLTQMLSKTLVSNFINQPYILAFFNLINHFCYRVKSWILFFIQSTYSLIVLLIATIAIFFYFYWKQYISGFNFYFSRTVNRTLSFLFWKLFYSNFLSLHFLAVAIFLYIIDLSEPDQCYSSFTKKSKLCKSFRTSITKFIFLLWL